ncbi:MAG: SBBP repeat-containing protein, partial [Aggregatilineales bacterium]
GSFPTTSGAFQPAYGGGGNDAFVTKLNAAGSALVYSTYLGGSDLDQANGIAVDINGNAYVTGETASTDFPLSSAAQGTAGGNTDAFVTKLNAAGSALSYSTYLGGGQFDDGTAIALDSNGNAYITGYTQSTNFPTTAGAYQTTFRGPQAVFVTKMASAGTLVYSTFLGGATDFDYGFGIGVDSSGDAYVTGRTAGGFPTTSGAYQTTFGGGFDAYLTKFNANGSALLYSTYLGGNGADIATGLALDSAGNAYITGRTSSSGTFPTTGGVFQGSYAGGPYDVFVAEFGFGVLQTPTPTPTATPPSGNSLVVVNCQDSGPGSLRDAVAYANQSGLNFTITFAANINCSTIALISGVIAIQNSMTILGPQTGQMVIDGNSATIFTVSQNATATIASLTLQDSGSNSLVINNGATVIDQSVLSSNGGNGFENDGGANSSLTIQDTTIQSSRIGGAGIASVLGNITITQSVISGFGAGLNVNASTLTMQNVTIANSGTGVSANSSSSISISNSTIAGNQVGINAPSLFLVSSIVAKNGNGADFGQTTAVISQGSNVIGNGSSANGWHTDGSDLIGTSGSPLDPQLGGLANNNTDPLQAYFNNTNTMALLSRSSPAFGFGYCNNVLNDQRGVIRRTPCDSGAYESNFALNTLTPTLTPSNTLTPTNTYTATATYTPTFEGGA